MAKDVNGVIGGAGRRHRTHRLSTRDTNISIKPDTFAMGKRHNDLTQEEV